MPGRLISRVVALPQVGDLFGAHAIPLVMVVVLNIVTAAVLGPEGKGRASYMVMATFLLASILFFSLHVGAVQTIRSGDESGAARGLVESLWIVLIAVGAMGGLVWAGVGLGPNFLTPIDWAFMLAGMALAILSLYVLRTIQGLGLARSYRRLSFLQTGVYVGATALFLATELTPAKVMAAWAVGQGVGLAAGLRVLAREVPLIRVRGKGGSVLRPALAAHVGNMGHQVMYRANVLVLGILGTATQVGLYAMATGVAEALILIADAFSLAIFAEGRSHLNEEERLKRLVEHLHVYRRLGALAAVLAAVGGWFLFTYVLKGFDRSIPLLFILLPGVWAGGAGRIRLSAVIAADNRRIARIVGAASAIGSLLYIPLIHLYGMFGAAVTSCVLYAGHAALLGALIRKEGALAIANRRVVPDDAGPDASQAL